MTFGLHDLFVNCLSARVAAPIAALAVSLCAASPLCAQDRPFIFSITTSPETSQQQLLVSYDIGVGEPSFQGNDTARRPEQRFAAQASLGRWTLVGHVGLSSVGSSSQSWQQGEVLFSVFQQQRSGVNLAMGGGVLHEAGGVNVLVGRVAAGRDFDAWRLHGNLTLQAPMSGERDAVDVMTTIGWSRRLTASVSLGVEAVGQDFEGFWEPAEAEGGARLLVGPSLHIAPRGKRWQFTVAGGPIFRPTDSARSSDALRDLPATTNRVSYAVRTAFAYGF
jgi:hypothetical protein